MLPPGGRDSIRAALPALGALAEAPAGTRLVWAGSASGDYPVFFGEGLIVSGFASPRDGRRFVVTETNVRATSRWRATNWSLVDPGEERKTLATPKRCCAPWRAAGGAR